MKKVLLRTICSISFIAVLLSAFAVNTSATTGILLPFGGNDAVVRAAKDATFNKSTIVRNVEKKRLVKTIVNGSQGTGNLPVVTSANNQNTLSSITGDVLTEGFVGAPYTVVTSSTCPQGIATVTYSGATIEEFQIPAGVTNVRIRAIGASGGNDVAGNLGGKGAIMQGNFTVVGGEKLYMIVGQKGFDAPAGTSFYGGGGGGGTFVARKSNLSATFDYAGIFSNAAHQTYGDLLIAAGAGGGGGFGNKSGTDLALGGNYDNDANIVENANYGSIGSSGSYGQNGGGGSAGINLAASAQASGGGAGYLSDGVSSGTRSGKKPSNNATGGFQTAGALTDGGYGGGGCLRLGSGGGGGFSGGGGGGQRTATSAPTVGTAYFGGGGGSFISPLASVVNNIKTSGTTETNGNGVVVITWSIPCSTPLVPGTIGTNQTICFGATPAALTSATNASGGTGTISYQWQSSTDNINFFNIPGATSSTYAPGALTQTTYYKRAASTTTDAAVYTSSVTITVNPLPTVTVSPSAPTITNGGNVSLTASGASTYTWLPATGLSATTGATVTANPTTTTTYTVTGTNANNCVNTTAVTVTVNQLPATALNFDGVNDKVTVTNTTLGNFGSGDFTVEMSVRTALSSGVEYLATKRGFCGGDNFWSLQIVNGKLNMEMAESNSAPTNYVALVGTTTISNGLWHHVALTRKNGTVNIYVDGALELSNVAVIANINNNYTLEFGSSVCNVVPGGNGSVKFVGDMDEIRIWSRALCTAELDHNRSCELALPQTGLQAYYKLNAGYINANNAGITSAVDATGNGNTGTLTNFGLIGATTNWVAGIVTGTCSAYNPVVGNITGSGTVCAGSTTQLSNATPGGSWSSSNNTIATVDVSGLVTGVAAGSVTISYTSLCEGVATFPVTVNAKTTPTFTQIAGICRGVSLSPLPTTSDNNITGTWSPALNNLATTTYTFTPGAGQCATTATMTITVNENTIVPLFYQVGDICSGQALDPLHTISDNGITGTWSPALDNTTTTTYTFTPNAGQCATTTTMTITVNQLVTPTFQQVAAICSGANLAPLPTESYNGIRGTWSPALNNTATTTYRFTPNVGQCGTTATMTIIVNELPSVTVGSNSPVCSNSTINLTSTGGYSSYQWTGPIGGISDIQNPSLDNAGPAYSGTYTVRVTDANGCVNIATTDVVVNPTPWISFVTGATSVCPGANTILTAIANEVVSPVFNWYDAPSGGNLLFTGDVFTTPNLTENTSFYVDVTSNGCTQPWRTVVLIYINNLPIVTVNPINPVCVGETIELSATAGNYYSYAWTGPNSFTSEAHSPVILNTQFINAGTYNVVVTDGNGCVASATATVVMNALPTITAGSNGPVCYGGVVNLTSNGGVSYEWYAPNGNGLFSFNQNPILSNVSYAESGTYTVKGTDANGCRNKASVEVIIKSLPGAWIFGNTSVCPGGSTVLTAGTNFGLSYLWNTGAVTQSIIVNTPGDYYVTVTDPNTTCSETSYPVTVTAGTSPDAPVVEAYSSTILCPGGSVTLASSWAESYLWSNGATTQSILVDAAGSYTVTGKFGGCPTHASAPVTVTVNPLPSGFTVGGGGSYCAGGAGVSVYTGGSTIGVNYSLIMNGDYITTLAGTGNDLYFNNVMAAGNYTVVATNATTGCTAVMPGSATVTVNTLPDVTANTVNPVCVGEKIELFSSPGVSYSWTGPNGFTSTDHNPFILNAQTANAGTYTVVVTDANGCSASATATSVVNTLPVILAGSNSPVCEDGTLNLTSNGGVSYIWNGPNGFTSTDQNPVLNNVTLAASGTYFVKGTGANGCRNDASVTVTVTAKTTPTFTQVAAICSGASLAALPTTSLNNITGVWSPALNNTATTTYTFTPNAGQCATITTMTITVNTNVAPTFTQVAAICSGGSLSALPTTSNNNITGTWSPALNNEATTTYTFTPNAGQCATTATMTITANNPTSFTITNNSPTICEGNTTQLFVNVSSMSGVWSSSNPSVANTEPPFVSNFVVAHGVSAGSAVITYTYTNANGCVSTATTNISVTPRTVPTFNQVAAICAGASLAALPTTSTNNITGVWSPALNNTATTTYTFVPDFGQCAASTTMTITVNLLLDATASNNGPACSGGSLQLNASGGVSYLWSGPMGFNSTSPNTGVGGITTAWAGVYSVVVTDANGCKSTATTTVVVNTLPPIGGADNICVGSTTTLTGSGTPAAVNPWWSTNQTVATVNSAGVVTGVASGNTLIIYTNSSGCTVNMGFQVNALPTITGTFVSCAGRTRALTGSGTPAVSNPWTSSNTAVATVDNTGVVTAVAVAGGTAVITYTNANGCSISITFTVPPLPPTPTVSVVNNCDGTSTLTASGYTDYQWALVGGPITATGTSITVSTPGTYGVRSASAQCVSSFAYGTAAPKTTPVVNILPNGPTTFCAGGSVTLNADPSSGLTYSWSPGGSTGSSITVNTSGTYTLTGTNAGGCFSSASVTVTVNPKPVITFTQINSKCFGWNTGSIDVTVTSGTTPYTYSWSNSATTQDINNLAPGTYTLNVTDAVGCTASISVTITEPATAVTVISYGASDPTCFGATDANFTVNAGGGNPGYTYALNYSTTYQASPTFNGLVAGVYYVTVKDAVGCEFTRGIVLTDPAQLQPFNVTGGGAYCAGTGGLLPVGLSGSQGGVYYQLVKTGTGNIGTPVFGNGSAIAFGNFPAGTYTVVALRPANASCTLNMTGSAVITQKPVPPVLAYTSTLNCDGSVNLTAKNQDNSPITGSILWSPNNETTATILVTTTGVYNAVQTINGCTSNNAPVNITPAVPPSVFTVAGGESYCSGGSGVSITLSGSETNVEYFLMNGAAIVNIINGTGSAISFNNVMVPGTYTINAHRIGLPPACVVTMTGSANVSINTAPAIVTCFGDQTLNAGANCTANLNLTSGFVITSGQPVASVSYALTGATTGSGGGTGNGHVYNKGITTVTVTVSNICGTVTCSYTVTVVDITAPVVSNCPASPITVNTGTGRTTCDQAVTWAAPTATDNCGVTSITSTHNSGDVFPVGTTTVTYTFKDAANNTSTCSFNVTVVDNTPPVAPVIADATGQCSATATAPAAIDNCSGTVTGTTSDALTYTTQGTHVIHWTFTDGKSNTSTANQNVVVKDVTPPVAHCPGNISVPVSTVNDLGQGGALVTYAATATDNCSATVSYSIEPGSFFPVGTTTVTVTATDVAGNKHTCTFDVTVTCVNPVVAPIQGVVSQICADNFEQVFTNITEGGTWSSSNQSVIIAGSNGELYPQGAGTATISYTVINEFGCSTTATKDVTVNALAEIEEIITSSNSACVNATLTLTNNTTGGVWSSADEAMATVTSRGVVTGVAGGNVIIRYTVTNASGCSSYTETTITINPLPIPLIVTGPTVVCVGSTINISIENLNGHRPEEYTIWSNSNPNIAVTGIFRDHITVTGIAAGTTTVSATFIDGACPRDIATIVITVNATPVKPIITPAGSVTVCLGGSLRLHTAVVNDYSYQWQKNGVNIADATSADYIATENGSYSVIVTNSNGCGSTPSDAVVVTFEDVTPPATPTLAPIVAQCSAIVPPATTMDACAGTITGTTSDALTYTTQGDFVIHWTFTDPSGNKSYANQNVSVHDITPPVAHCPGNISVDASTTNGSGQSGALVSYVATATDNCGATVSYSKAPGSFFPVGTTTVTVTATDVAGNKHTCTFDVTVTCVIATPTISVSGPTVFCPSGSVKLTSSSATGNHWSTGDATQSITVTASGSYSVTVTDAATNCSATSAATVVTVQDITPPTIVCPAPVTVQCASAVPAVNIATVTATDNCSVVVSHVSDVISNQTALNKFTITRTYKAMDPSGNSATCTQIITVNDNTAPTLIVVNSLPGNSTGQCLAGVPGAPSTSTIEALYTDNCTGTITAVLLNTTTSGSNATGWIRKYFYTVTDASGNSTTACAAYSGRDTQAPVPNVATLPTVTAQCGATVTPPTATDNCAGTITATTNSPLTYNAQGTYTITWTYSDGNGNTSTQIQTVVVKDVTPPVINCPSDITVTANTTMSGTSGANVSYTVTATDNCGVPTITYSQLSGSFFPVGTTTVTATANDGNGNTASCTFKVIVGCAPFATSIASVKTSNVYTGANVPSTTLFIGYGAQNTTLQAGVPAGTYTYAWSGASVSMLSSTTSANPVFTPTHGGSYTFNVTVTNAAGCSSTSSITICVTDIRVFASVNNNTSSCGHQSHSSYNCPHQGHNHTCSHGSHSSYTCPDNGNSNNCAHQSHSSYNCPHQGHNHTCSHGSHSSSYCPDKDDDDDHQTMCNHQSHSSYECPHKGHNHECSHRSHSSYSCAHRGTNDRDDDDEKDCDHRSHSSSECSHRGHNHSACNHQSHSSSNCPHHRDNTTQQTVCNHQSHSSNDCNHSGHNHNTCNHQSHSASNCVHNNNGSNGGCDDEDDDKKVYICHTPPGNTGNPLTLSISVNAVASHLANHPGDRLGSCSQTPCTGYSDTEKPVIDCPDNKTVAYGSSTLPAVTGSPEADDNSGDVIITYSDVSTKGTNAAIASFYNYTISRTWKAADLAGNYSTCAQSITVTETVKPVITCPGAVTVACGSTAPAVNATATDNASPVTITYTDAVSGNTTARTWRATDASGNYATCTQIITVADNVKPVISDVADATVSCGSSTAPSATGIAIATDNCSTATVTYSDAASGNVIKRTWKATDAAGNYSTSTQIITVGLTFTASVSSVPGSSTYTGGVSTNLYLGYGAQTTILQMCSLPSAGAPYTYAWSGSYTNKLNSTTTAAPLFTPATFGYYTFSVTVTNKFGCTSTATISICVTDVRVAGTSGSGAKVYMCHTPSGYNKTSQTIQVLVSQVPSHLGSSSCGSDGNDRLGTCGQSPCNTTVLNTIVGTTLNATKEGAVATSEEELKVTAMPNPSTTYFTLKLESKYETPVSMRVMDGRGRVVDAKSKIGANSTIQIGHNYSSGTYYAELIQGTQRKVVQLIKGKG